MNEREKEMALRLASLKELVVFDLETTGTSPEKYAEICEIGAVKINFEKGKITGKFSQLIKPRDGKIPKAASEKNHITDDMVKDCPYFEEVLPAFYSFIDGKTLLAHNSSFDERFLKAYFPMVGKVYLNSCLDSLAIDKYLHPERKEHNLAAICASYGHEHSDDAHRALADASATAACVNRFRQEILEEIIFDIPEVSEARVGYADTSYLRLGHINPYKYKNKNLGIAVFFGTNFGTFYYNLTRKVWGMQRMYIDSNINMEEASAAIKKATGKEEKDFLKFFPDDQLTEKDKMLLS